MATWDQQLPAELVQIADSLGGKYVFLLYEFHESIHQLLAFANACLRPSIVAGPGKHIHPSFLGRL